MELTFKSLIALNDFDKNTMEFVVKKHTADDLKGLLRDNGIKGYSKLNKAQLVQLVIDYVNSAKDGKIVTLDTIKPISKVKSKVKSEEKMLNLYLLKELQETNMQEFIYPNLTSKEMKSTIMQYSNKISTKGLKNAELLEIIKDIAKKI